MVQEDAEHARIADHFFRATDRGEVVGVILAAVLAECVFVLQSFYNTPRPLIASGLGTLLTAPNIRIDSLSVCLETLRLYASTIVHFIDCLIAATAIAEDWSVATFDWDFVRFAGVRVEVD